MASIIKHTVVKGDNLWDIAEQHGADHREIVRYVEIEDRDLIQPGWTLLVPVDDAEPPAEEPDEPPAEEPDEPPAEEPDEPPAEEPPAQGGPLAEHWGAFGVLNRDEGDPGPDEADRDHAETFEFYAAEFDHVPVSYMTSLHKLSPSHMGGNTGALVTYWDPANYSGPRPQYFDVLVPLGFTATDTTSRAAELRKVLSGAYDAKYRIVFNNLKKIGIRVIARIGNEPNLASPWCMLLVDEDERDLYGRAFDHVARLGRSILPDMLAGYCPNHSAVQPLKDYAKWWYKQIGKSAPAWQLADPTPVYEYAIDADGLDEVDVYQCDLYQGNQSAQRLVECLEYVADLAERDGKLVMVPEWGIWADEYNATEAEAGMDLMLAALQRVNERGLLLTFQYFDDDKRFMLKHPDNWGGRNLRPVLAAKVKAFG